MATTSRQVILGQTVVLEIDIKDALGNRIDPDAPPEMSIADAFDVIVRPMSSYGIIRTEVGRFRVNYVVPTTARTGIWIDKWKTVVNGFPTDASFNFIVMTASTEIDVSGDQIGDPARVSYTQEEIIGINILLESLQMRLKNKLQVETTDAYGNITFVDCHIFTNEELVWFLNSSLQEFNSYPHFSSYKFSDPVIYQRFCHVIIEGALISAFGAQLLIEKGREFSVTDNGISFTPPQISEALNSELTHFAAAHREVLKNIKFSLKPGPIGFGNSWFGTNPAYRRLRFLKERRII